MKTMTIPAVLFLLLAVVGFHSPAAKTAPDQQVFVGQISDGMCGFHHPMKDAKRCTLGCVKGFNDKFVLADSQHHKIYQLSDQGKAKRFAGEDVRVTGRLDGDTIKVAKIESATKTAPAAEAPIPITGGMYSGSMSPTPDANKM